MAAIMRRSGLFFIFLLMFGFTSGRAEDEIAIVPGLITANNVDVTADDGSILADRLNVGDTLYIIQGGKNQRKGWVRVSRSPSDKAGIGWVESKFIRTVSRYTAPSEEARPSREEQTGEKTILIPDVESSKYNQVGVLPFEATDPDDPIVRVAYDSFTMSLRNNGHLKLAEGQLKNEKVNIESPDELRRVADKYHVDGVFVGKLSGLVGGSRLLQIKFFGKDRESFVLEKVTRLPSEGNLQTVIDGLVSSTVKALK